MPVTTDFRQLANFIWSIADLLRHDYRQADYGKVVLPFTVLRRLDCVLEPTKANVLAKLKDFEKKTKKPENIDPVLNAVAGQKFHNRSQFNFAKLAADDQHPAANLRAYINGFSTNARDILEYFEFNTHIERLERSKLLYQVIEKFNERDLYPEVVDNETMGLVFEELIRKFAEISNETAGEHFTPREVIELMVNILFIEDSASLSQPGIVRTLYDPACGTGGMLAMGEDHVRRLNKDARIEVFGQEINPESYAICKADMLIKGKEVAHIKFGNVFPMDGLPNEKFDYFLSNPPFGVEWRKVEKFVREEHEKRGWDGRFGAGLPRVSDGSLLFIQHMISKFKPASQGGSRLAIIFNGSPLFTGGPGSGESEIRRWIIENDWLEAIIALPDQLFFNTGISTYLWIVTNRKLDLRKKKIQLIDASQFFVKMPRSLGNKRNLIGDGAAITRLYGDFKEGPHSKIFDNLDFGYRRITVERPLRLAFEVTDKQLERISTGETEITKLDKLAQAVRTCVVDTLTPHIGRPAYKNRDQFEEWLIGVQPDTETFGSDERALVMEGLSFKDETADPIIRRVADAQPNEQANAVDLNRRGLWLHHKQWVKYVADADLRDFENVPLKVKIEDYFDAEVRPNVADAWISGEPKIGYEIPFTRHFYQYTTPRPLEEIQKEVEALEADILGKLKEAQGLISHAVTRGLNPNAPTKPSGLPWLGNIPVHWETKKLKYLARFAGGATPDKSNSAFWNGTIPWVSPKDMKVEEITDTEDHITETGLTNSATTLIAPGAVLIVVRSGILQHTIPVAINLVKVAMNQDMRALITNSLMDSRYLALVIRGLQGVLLTQWRKEGATVESLEYEFMSQCKFPLPPIEEQKAIVNWLGERIAHLSDVGENLQTQLAKLREYRQALITAAVTGQVVIPEKPV